MGELVQGLGVNTRVLMIGAHPDDEDTYLIAWLSRGRHVTTAYLSLTRGDGGQNIIGNELGEALGVLRTEELLAARRIDGALQYFTRAYDFGFSKDTTDTFDHWPRDTILGDVVRVVRAFRPHVIVSVFSGTPRDGHGHHQVSGILAREAFDLAGDTGRFARAYGAPWTPLKFYRAARGNAEAGTLGMNVGEYSPLLGESYGEIAGRSRSQHKSQGFGSLERKGPIMNYVRREATRVNEATPATDERSLFDGIDTTWARLRPAMKTDAARAWLDSLPHRFLQARDSFDPFDPSALLEPLSDGRRLIGQLLHSTWIGAEDALASLQIAAARVDSALRIASGVTIETNGVELMPVGQEVGVLVTVYNRGRDTVAIDGGMATGAPVALITPTRLIAPGAWIRDTLIVELSSIGQPWWLASGRRGAMFVEPWTGRPAGARPGDPRVGYTVDLGGASLGTLARFETPVSHLIVDQVRGEITPPSVGAPAVTVRLDRALQYAPANADIDREVAVHVRSNDGAPRDVRVRLHLPAGLRADSADRTIRLDGHGSQRTLRFRMSGRLRRASIALRRRPRVEGHDSTSGPSSSITTMSAGNAFTARRS